MRHLAARYLTVLVGLALLGAGPDGRPAVGGEPVPTDPQQVRREVAELVQDLDAPQYAVRQKAAERLKRLVDQPSLGRELAEQFQQVLIRPETSLEVRSQLEPLCGKLPRAPSEPSDGTPPEEIRRLVAQLEDDSYAVRLGAARRLDWLLDNSHLVGPIITELRARMLRGDLSPDARRWLEPAWQRARGLWLTTDPAQWNLPPVSDQQIHQWIDDLARSAPANVDAKAWGVHQVAQRELRDVLARDDYVPRVRQAIQKRLAGSDVDPDGVRRLGELIDLCRPAMVAEYWQQGEHRGIQHLLIGVPSQSPGVSRPSHFDRIDDETAHCVSGSNLTEGDYPVGVAIPHPNQGDALFHLVNLSTPRRRMAYEYLSKTGEAKRLAQLSRRTCDRYLRLAQSLEEGDFRVLLQLDPREVSRFASKFFAAVDDEYPPTDGPRQNEGWPGRHAMLCRQLADEGTHEAIDGLLEAIRRGRILPPREDAPHELAWIAALSIAARDPWPEVDSWLAGAIERTDPLVIDQPDAAPELGATAAALLLERHRETPANHGLERAEERLIESLHVTGYRFVAPQARQKVLQWWKTASQLQKTSG